jgi:nitric oxide reductase subunit B
MNSMPLVTESPAPTERSPWWERGVVFTLVFGFSVLILIAVTTYRNAPPIPDRAVTSTGAVLFRGEDIALGQEVFLKYGLMDNGSVWGHGAYLGPDFTASYLHDLAVDVAEQTALARFGRSYAGLAAEDKGAVGGIVATRLRKNGYDPITGVLTLAVGDHGFFDREQARWSLYFEQPSMIGGLRRNAITDKA